MGQLADQFPDIRFGPNQLYLSDEDYRAIATDFWPNHNLNGSLTNIDRAFIQAALFVCVNKSEQALAFFDLFAAFVSSAPSLSVRTLVRKLATTAAKREFQAYIDDTPKYSAVGKAAIQYSEFSTQWRTRVALNDTSFLDNFQKPTP